MDAQVIIIGAGPAGSCLGYNLAREGIDVLILEKESWPRYKACGGAISAKTSKLLFSKGLDLPEDIIENKINNFFFRFDYQKEISFKYEGEAIKLVNRKKFDNFLLKKAKEAGAVFKDRQKVVDIKIGEKGVTVKTENKEYKSQIIAGADGANSRVLQTLNLAPDGLYNNKGIAIEAELVNNINNFDQKKVLIDFGFIAKGYGWVFPKKKQISIGVGSLDNKPIDIKKIFYSYLKELNVDYNKNNLFYKAHPIPFIGDNSKKIKVGGNRYVLLGDAAYLAESLIGEGIFNACFSAEIASDVIVEKIKKNKFDLSNYNHKINKKIYMPNQIANKISDLFYNSLNYIYYLISFKPDILKMFFDVLQSNDKYDNLYQEIFINKHKKTK